MFYQLSHVPVSLIPFIDPLPNLFPKESPTSLSESPPSITDVPFHASDELPAPIIGVPTELWILLVLLTLMHFVVPIG